MDIAAVKQERLDDVERLIIKREKIEYDLMAREEAFAQSVVNFEKFKNATEEVIEEG